MTDEEKQPDQVEGVLPLESAPEPAPEPVPEPGEQQAEPSAAQGGSPETGQASAPVGDAVFDPKSMHKVLWRIVKNPETGLGDAHVPGRAGLLHGLVFGGAAVAVIAVSGLTEDSTLLISWLGGATFLAVGTMSSLLLRLVAGNAEQIDWKDDAFLVGGSLCYPLVAAVLSGLLCLAPALEGVAHAVRLAGFLLGAFAYAEGLVDVGRVEASSRIWMAVAVLTMASAVANMLDFVPFA